MSASRLAPDWEPTQGNWTYAIQRGLSEQQILRIAEDFRDYWVACPGQRGLKLDWDLTWNTWVRRSADRVLGPRPSGDMFRDRRSIFDIQFELESP